MDLLVFSHHWRRWFTRFNLGAHFLNPPLFSQARSFARILPTCRYKNVQTAIRTRDGRSAFALPRKPPSTIPARASAAAQHGVASELAIVSIWIVQRVMEAAAFFAAQRRIDYQGGHSREITQLQQIYGYFEIPIELANFTLEISQPRTCALQPFIGAHNSDVIPHQASDLIPVMINHDQLIDVLHISRFPFRQRDFLFRSRSRPTSCAQQRAMRHHQTFQQRVASKPIRSVQPGARDLANCIKPVQTRRAIHVSFDSTALIMRSLYYRNRLLRHVDPKPQTCLVNVRETLLNEFRRFMRDIQKHALRA